MDPVACVVTRTPALERPSLVAVDGVDGSGKTTFAARLADAYAAAGRPAHVVHEDDFLNPRSVRYRLGRDSPKGYFLDSYDLRALAASVLDPLAAERDWRIVPRVFDHRTDTPVAAEPVAVAGGAVVIVEGMFLHRDELFERWDLSVFLDVPFIESVRRMAGRDGTEPDPEHPSMHRYVAGQRFYLKSCRPHDRAALVFEN